MNFADLVVVVAVGGMVLLAVAILRKNRRIGNRSCGCRCSDCGCGCCFTER